MKVISIVLLYGATAFSLQWSVIGQDSTKPVYEGTLSVSLKKSIGQISVELFTEKNIPFKGSSAGIQSLLETPIGDDAMVIESDRRMRVYGWCFTVDGKLSEAMPDQSYLMRQDSILVWFYAFSQYDGGEWTSFCTPAYTFPLKKED